MLRAMTPSRSTRPSTRRTEAVAGLRRGPRDSGGRPCPASMTVSAAVSVGLHGVEHLAEWPNECLRAGTVVPRAFTARVTRSWNAPTGTRPTHGRLLAAAERLCARRWGLGRCRRHGVDHAHDPAASAPRRSAVALWSRNAVRPAPGDAIIAARDAARRLRDHVARSWGASRARCPSRGRHGRRLHLDSCWPVLRRRARHLASVLPAEAVLAAATTNAAEDLGVRGPGRLQVGSRADLLVLDQDPHGDAASVVRAGRWSHVAWSTAAAISMSHSTSGRALSTSP